MRKFYEIQGGARRLGEPWRLRFFTLVALVGVLAVVSTGCQTTKSAAGAAPAKVRSTFYYYYMSGLWHAKKMNWRDASEEFRVALGERAGAQFGRSTDVERVRTYGMHFERDYFPNRELGVSLYHVARTQPAGQASATYAEAIKYLERSQGQHATARALDYLRMTHGAMRQLSGAPGHGPRFVRSSLDLKMAKADGGWDMNTANPVLRGQIQSNVGIQELKINGAAVFIDNDEVDRRQAEIEYAMPLNAGDNLVRIHMTDFVGQQTEQQLVVRVDLEGPSISYLPSPSSAGVRVIVRDNSELSSVVVGGRSLVLESGQRQVETLLPVAQLGQVTIEARDLAGNISGDQPALAALHDLQRDFGEVSGNVQVAALGGSRRKGKKDQALPSVQVHPPGHARTIHGNVFAFDLQVDDGGAIEAVSYSVNRGDWQSVAVEKGALRHRSIHTLQLPQKDNEIVVRAVDAAGNEKKEIYRVRCALSARVRADLRLATIVLKPDVYVQDADNMTKRRVVPKVNPRVYDLMTDALVNVKPQRLSVLDESVSTLKVRVEEGLVAVRGDRKACFRLRSDSRPDWLLYGYLSFWSGKHEWDVHVYYEDLVTGEAGLLADMHFFKDDAAHIRDRMSWLAQKIRQKLPIHVFQPSQPQRGRLDFKLGLSDGVMPGMHMVLLEGGDYSKPLMVDGQMIEAVVEKVGQGHSRAVLYPSGAAKAVGRVGSVVVR